jgi:hypothetical protein
LKILFKGVINISRSGKIEKKVAKKKYSKVTPLKKSKYNKDPKTE